MSTSKNNIFLALDFSQLFDLARQLPQEERHRLVDMLMQEEASVPEEQKQLVRARIKKYYENPDLLIDEEHAIEMINNM